VRASRKGLSGGQFVQKPQTMCEKKAIPHGCPRRRCQRRRGPLSFSPLPAPPGRTTRSAPSAGPAAGPAGDGSRGGGARRTCPTGRMACWCRPSTSSKQPGFWPPNTHPIAI